MDYRELLEGLTGFVEKLQDEESREIFNARFDFCIHRDVDGLERRLIEGASRRGRTGVQYALEKYFQDNPGRRGTPFVLFGAGKAGRRSLRALRFLGLEAAGYVDNGHTALKTVEGLEVAAPERLLDEWKEYTVLITVMEPKMQDEIHAQLRDMGIREEQILKRREGCIWVDYGKQYFDLEAMQPDPDGEIFVDAGCFDGWTSANAAAWTGGKLLKVYAFEPDRNSIAVCQKRLEQTGCEFELYNAATWSEKTTLAFNINDDFGYASNVDDAGKDFVSADSIDRVLNGRPATYIKLDVEGSELETLRGAVNTIKRYRPKLAISLYHKAEDVIDLPLFIESLGMDYKYYIRHYQTRWCETTLYAL